jgi:hypothetical protein
VVLLAFDWIPGIDANRVLSAMAVGSGAACVGASYSLAKRLTSNARVAAVAGTMVGLSPVVWSASGMIEIHVFGGAGACLAAWAACSLPVPPWARAGLATLLAMATHMTNVLLVPLFLALALEEVSARGVRAQLRLLAPGAAACGLVVVLMHVVGSALPPRVEEMESALPLLLRGALDLLTDPSKLVRFLGMKYLAPWLLVGLAPLAWFLPGRTVSPLTCWTALGTGVVGAMLVATYIPMAGQYGLVLCPALVLGLTHALAWLDRIGRLREISGLAILLLLPFALLERARLIVDPDREWAAAAAPALSPASTVLCLGLSRKMRIAELTHARAVDFQSAGDHGAANAAAVIQDALETAALQGRTTYLDPRILDVGPRIPPLAPLVAELRRSTRLTEVAGGRLVRVDLAGE